MNAEWRREVQVPLGVLSYAGTATAGQGLAFNARLGVWHEVAAAAPAMGWGGGLRAMKNSLLALPRGPAMSGAATVLLLAVLGLAWVSSLVREGRGAAAPSVGSASVMGVASAGALAMALPSRPVSRPPESPVLAASTMPSAAAPVAPASHGAGESPALVPSRVLQAARSPVLPRDTDGGHTLPAAPDAQPPGRWPTDVATGRTGAGRGEHLGVTGAALRGHEQTADAARARPAPGRAHGALHRQSASHQRAPRADKRPVRSADPPVASAPERGRPIAKPEGAVATADFRLAPFGAMSGRTGVAGRDVLVAIKDASTVIVANQRGMPTPFRLGEKLPSGAVLLSIHPRLESAETDRGVIRLE